MSFKRRFQSTPLAFLRLLICSVMIIGVGILTATAHHLMQARIKAQADIKFAELTDSYVRQLSSHIEGTANLLYAMRGLFAATNGAVSADAWKRFIETQHSFERYPGIKVVGYAPVIRQSQVAAYNTRLQKDLGLPSAGIHPLAPKSDYAPLTYLQESKPATPRNLGAYGFDLASEPLRQEALAQAKASGGVAATAPLNLVPDGKVGFLLVMPLDNGPAMGADSVGGQGASNGSANTVPTTQGYAITAFDAELLLNTLFGKRLSQYHTGMTVTDISGPSPTPLYHTADAGPGQKVTREVTLQAANRTWRITFQTPARSLLMITDRLAPLAVLVGGIVLILAAGGLFYTFRLRKALRRNLTS